MKIGNACACEYKEAGHGVGDVVGYILIQECDECKAKREASTLIEKQRKDELEAIRLAEIAKEAADDKEYADLKLKVAELETKLITAETKIKTLEEAKSIEEKPI